MSRSSVSVVIVILRGGGLTAAVAAAMSARARSADSATRADEHSSRNCNRLTRQDQQQDEETPPPPSILSQPVWSEDTMSGSTATRTATFVQALSETPLEAQLADSKFKFIPRSLYQQRNWPISDIAHDTLSAVRIVLAAARLSSLCVLSASTPLSRSLYLCSGRHSHPVAQA
ncbi:hypothetical protein BGY98DRAFT_1098128 [Russula aff. rugulosa BPL654]|nr:hypothetical protein BGY98DRAFT_1098128 [Russula aff. rugulosa BPL654]